MKKLILALTVLFHACAPANRDPQDVLILDVEAAWKNLKVPQIKLSSFIDSITYVFPKNTPKATDSAEFPNTTITKHHILMGKRMYDRNGNYLQDREWPDYYSVFSDSLKEVYTWPPGKKIDVYDFTGKFVRQLPVSHENVWGFTLGSDGNLLLMRNFDHWEGSDSTFFEFQSMDARTGKILHTRKSSKYRTGDRDMISPYFTVRANEFWPCNGRTYYYEAITDTIYTLKNGQIEKPLYVLKEGNYNPSFERLRDEQISGRKAGMSFFNFVECDAYLFFTVQNPLSNGITKRYAYYNKRDSSLYIYKFRRNALYNDVDGLPIGGFLGTTPEGDLYNILYADYLCEHRKSLDPSSPFKKRIDQMKPDDNPVIRIFHVRKNTTSVDRNAIPETDRSEVAQRKNL